MEPTSAEFKKAALALRARAFSQTPGLLTQVENAFDPRYWRDLNSELTLCGHAPSGAVHPDNLDHSSVERSLQMFSSFGYFQMPAVLARPTVDKMRRCIEVTRGAGWHPVFAFIYDEFWRAFRIPAIANFLRGALGEGYRQLPFLWGHYVPANSKGWPPHVDGPSKVKKVTVWLALNDATLENGCMYVVPRNTETEKISDQFSTVSSAKSFMAKDTLTLLQNAKALPATPGSYLGWGPYVIHWGSMSGPQATARISISAEFAAPSDPLEPDLTLMNAGADSSLPSFRERLHLIAQALESYEFFDPEVFRCVPLARQIISRIAVEEI